MKELPDACVDAIFADPPYNLRLGGKTLYRPEDQTAARAVRDNWDSFESDAEYDAFTRAWLFECKRVLKPEGSMWVIGSYHNIFKVGAIMQDLGFWILNDIIWVKTNPMPNFRGTRFTNAHETLIWATPQKTGKYTFNYDTMKKFNGGKQMRSDWGGIDICLGGERLKDDNGKSLHTTQKPADLLRRVILSSTKVGDVILDPFFGSGTTGAVARELSRNWIGIEKEQSYIEGAMLRINSTNPVSLSEIEVAAKREEVRVAFMELVSGGLLHVGQTLVGKRGDRVMITRDGMLQHTLLGKSSIHVMAAQIQKCASFNGWDYWSAEKRDGSLVPIDDLRKYVREVKCGMKKAA
jgi:modification methylase